MERKSSEGASVQAVVAGGRGDVNYTQKLFNSVLISGSVAVLGVVLSLLSAFRERLGA